MSTLPSSATDGTIVSIAGTGEEGSVTAGVRDADDIGFDAPGGVAAAGRGGVLVADTGNDAIRLISANGRVTTLVGRSGSIRADLESPGDVTSYIADGYLIADTGHDRVLRVTPAGEVEVVAGSDQAGYSGDGGPAAAARLNHPTEVFAGAGGTVLIADTGNGAVRRVLPSRLIETIARGLDDPEGVLGLADGAVVVASAEGLHRVAPQGSVSRIAGGAKRGYNGDRGAGTDLLFDGLGQIALGADGRILFAERGSDRIRAFDAVGNVDTIAGSGEPMREPTVGVAAGAFPPELSSTGPAGAAAPGAKSSQAPEPQSGGRAPWEGKVRRKALRRLREGPGPALRCEVRPREVRRGCPRSVCGRRSAGRTWSSPRCSVS
jgi:hypothetical protein